VLNFFDKKIKAIDEEIKAVLNNDTFKEKTEIIASFKGCGDHTVGVLLSDLPELGNLDRRAIAKLVGVAPIARDSGTFNGKRCIQGGRQRVRKALYLCALSACRFNHQIKVFYERLITSGKSAKTALIACARKMLCILNAMINHNEKWRGESLIKTS